MTIVPNVRILAAMGRLAYGLVLAAAFAAGCASAAAPDEQTQNVGDNADLAGVDLAGGMVVDNCMPNQACTIPGNPGDCAMGTTFCSGDVQSCVPNATTQSCYDGPPGTRNKGICKPGTQTCIGSLGSCDGEVKPAAQEDCFNDLDDDCDGVVNNGCPDHFVTGTPRQLTARGNPAGGGAFSLRCPANSYVTKLIVSAEEADGFVGGIDIACATPTLVRGTSSYTVSVAAVAVNPNFVHAAKDVTTDNFTFDCGTTAFSPGWWSAGTQETGSGGGVDAVGMLCANGAVALDATNKLSVTMTKTGSINYFGYPQFGTQFEDDCNANEVVVGYDGSDGNYFDSIRAVCAPLQVVYK